MRSLFRAVVVGRADAGCGAVPERKTGLGLTDVAPRLRVGADDWIFVEAA